MPAAQLAWYVNGEKADDVHLRTYPDETTIDGLKTSRLGLTFKVRAQSYDPNPPPCICGNYFFRCGRLTLPTRAT